MDALQFAGAVTLTDVGGDVSLHNRTSGVTGPDSEGVRVWLRNGWGIKIEMEGGEGSQRATVTTLAFAGPFPDLWAAEPAWTLAMPDVDGGNRMTGPGVWPGVTRTEAASLLSAMSDLPRAWGRPADDEEN